MRGLGFLIKFSYRNLWRSPKRTFIMILSLSLGTGFIIWDMNFATSGSKEIMNEFLAQYAGLQHITHPNYYDKNNRKEFNNFKIISDDDISDKTLFEKSTQRITAPVFISGMTKTLGVLLTGIDVEKEKKLTSLHKVITEGRSLDAKASREIVIGKKLAQRINVKLGDEVAVVGQALDGSVANDLMKVVGFLDFGGGELEESLAFTQIDTARELMVIDPQNYHQRVNFDMSREVIAPMKNVEVVPWFDILPEMGVSVRFIDNFTWIVSVIIVLVVSLGLANTLMITFFEREQEFQSLNIIGAKSSWVALSLMIEVFLLGTVAIALGVVIGHFATLFFNYRPINIEMFTGGKPIIMGGMVIQPLVRLYPVAKYYWQVPMLIYFFLSLTMIYPLARVIRRSNHAI